MTFDVLQYIVAIDFGLFFLIYNGSASLMRKATADRMCQLINQSLQEQCFGEVRLSYEILRKALDATSSPLSVFGNLRVLLFFLSVWAFAMFFSQAIASFACKLMNPSASEHIVYTFACVFGGLYVIVAVVFLLVEKTAQALWTHLTMGSMRPAKRNDP